MAGEYPSLEGAIPRPLVESGDLTADVQAARPIRACSAIAPVSGIALIARGTCDFTGKIRNAVKAGATGVIVYTDDRPKVIMGGTATPATLSIPGVMVDHDVLLLSADGSSVEIGYTLARSAQGRGLATLAVREAVALVFECSAASQVLATTDARNRASIRLLERIGMQRAEESTALFRGEPCVEITYAIARPLV